MFYNIFITKKSLRKIKNAIYAYINFKINVKDLILCYFRRRVHDPCDFSPWILQILSTSILFAVYLNIPAI